MLDANQVNAMLESVFTVIETRVPTIQKLFINPPEAVKSQGAYGSVILGALFTGAIDGKVTITLDWATAFQFAEAITATKIDGFNELVQQALESFFQESIQGMADRFAAAGSQLEIRVLPTLVDTSVLLSERDGEGAVKIPIVADAGLLNLFFAFR